MNNRTTVNDRLKTRSKARGFITAEEVIGIRNPDYDEDNIYAETLRQIPGLGREIRIGYYILGR